TELLRQWRAQIPADAPNRFIINIQPDQVQAVAARLKEQGVADAQLFPMVRGRLVAINSNPVDPGRYRAERARGLIEREFNLSYAVEAPVYNRILQGRWFGRDAPELSIERGIAETLGVHVGDQLSRAVQFVFLFALAAGVLVLYAALSATQDERGHEAALARALGAARRQLWQAQLFELSALGAMAGLLAGLGASAIGWLLAHQ